MFEKEMQFLRPVWVYHNPVSPRFATLTFFWLEDQLRRRDEVETP